VCFRTQRAAVASSLVRFQPGLRIQTRIQGGQWIQEGKNEPQNKKKLKISCFEVLDVLF
jgi:hypothetical protein